MTIPCASIHILSRPCARAADGGLAGAALVSNPCCLTSSSVALETPWRLGLVYNYVIAARLRQVGARGQRSVWSIFRWRNSRLPAFMSDQTRYDRVPQTASHHMHAAPVINPPAV